MSWMPPNMFQNADEDFHLFLMGHPEVGGRHFISRMTRRVTKKTIEPPKTFFMILSQRTNPPTISCMTCTQNTGIECCFPLLPGHPLSRLILQNNYNQSDSLVVEQTGKKCNE